MPHTVLTPASAPLTDRLLRTMGYRIHHSPEDGYAWEWRHPRHRQNNRWETAPAHTLTFDAAWQDALSDALRRLHHPAHDALLQTVAVEHERWVLHQAVDRPSRESPDVAAPDTSSRRRL